MKKKVLAITLVACMGVGLAACGSSGSSSSETADTNAEDVAETAEAATADETAEEAGVDDTELSAETEEAADAVDEVESEVDTSNATYTIRAGEAVGGTHFVNYTLEKYKAAVEDATNGDIAVEIYPSNQLGTNAQMITGLQDGSIELVVLPSSYYSSFAPATAVVDVPFLFDDEEQLYEVLNNESNPLNDYMEGYGFKVACWLKNTNRYILGQDKYETIDDLKNQKIWTLPSTTLQEEMEAYGASPQSLDASDVAVALENGTVDAVETDPVFMNTQGLGESANYLNLVPATPMTLPFCFSATWFDSLPEDYQTLLVETAQQVVEEEEIGYLDEVVSASLSGLEEAGAEIAEPTDELLQQMQEASQSVLDSFTSESSDNNDIYEQLIALK